MNPLNYYRETKERHPGMLLMFRVGDFYELFEKDAETAAKVLGLSLTVRDKVFPMAGFPHHSLESHLRKLLHAGHRVAICDQIEPFSTRGAEVNRIVTPGFVPEDDEDAEVETEEKPKTLTYIGKGGNWKQVPWMFD
jgi:DNA mismatch repair protein MutS